MRIEKGVEKRQQADGHLRVPFNVQFANRPLYRSDMFTPVCVAPGSLLASMNQRYESMTAGRIWGVCEGRVNQ